MSATRTYTHNRVVRLWNRLPRDVKEPAFTEVLETWLALSNHIWLWNEPCTKQQSGPEISRGPNFSVTMIPHTLTYKWKVNLGRWSGGVSKSGLPQTFIKMLTAFISLVQGPCVIHHSPTSKQNTVFYKTVSENSKQSNSGYNKLHTIL